MLASMSSAAATDAPADAGRLMELIGAGWMTQAIHVAARHRIADAMAERPRTAHDIAQQTHCHAASLRRPLRALTTLGWCDELDDGSFILTTTRALLRSDGESSLRNWALWSGHYLWPAWAGLIHGVRTGASARAAIPVQAVDTQLHEDAEAVEVFHHAMRELTRLVASEIAGTADFTATRVLVDVGGGYGELLAAALLAYPETRGMLYDRPHARIGATRFLESKGLSDRCELRAGDFFEAIPGGADTYLLESVLHCWDDEHCTSLLQNCRDAMGSAGRLLLVERRRARRQREEFGELLRNCGLRQRRFWSTSRGFCILEAVPG